MWIEIVGYIAAACIAARAIPQLVLSVKTEFFFGVSFLTWITLFVFQLYWLGYAIRIESTPLKIAYGIATIVTLLLIIHFDMYQYNINFYGILLLLFLLGFASLGAGAAQPNDISTIVLSCGTILSCYPQTKKAYQCWRDKLNPDISPLTWLLSTIGTAGFAIYGIGINNPAIIIGNTGATLLSALTFTWVYATNKNYEKTYPNSK